MLEEAKLASVYLHHSFISDMREDCRQAFSSTPFSLPTRCGGNESPSSYNQREHKNSMEREGGRDERGSYTGWLGHEEGNSFR